MVLEMLTCLLVQKLWLSLTWCVMINHYSWSYLCFLSVLYCFIYFWWGRVIYICLKGIFVLVRMRGKCTKGVAILFVMLSFAHSFYLSGFIDMAMLFHEYRFILLDLSYWERFVCDIWETWLLFLLIDHFTLSHIYYCYFSYLLTAKVYKVDVLS